MNVYIALVMALVVGFSAGVAISAAAIGQDWRRAGIPGVLLALWLVLSIVIQGVRL